MAFFLTCLTVALIFLLLVSLLFVLRAPSFAECLLATQLIGTTGVAILAILSVAKSQPFLIDVALALALLTSITIVTFVQLRDKFK